MRLCARSPDLDTPDGVVVHPRKLRELPEGEGLPLPQFPQLHPVHLHLSVFPAFGGYYIMYITHISHKSGIIRVLISSGPGGAGTPQGQDQEERSLDRGKCRAVEVRGEGTAAQAVSVPGVRWQVSWS